MNATLEKLPRVAISPEVQQFALVPRLSLGTHWPAALPPDAAREARASRPCVLWQSHSTSGCNKRDRRTSG